MDVSAGTDAEQRAACELRDRLRQAGREAEVEPIRVRTRWAASQAIAMVAAVVGSVVAVNRPGIGFLIVLLAAASSILEVTGAANVLMRLTGSRASQNVWSPDSGDGRGLLVLAAPTDAPRDALFNRLALRVADPWLLIGGSLLLILVCCMLRLMGFGGNGLTGLQFLLTLVPLGAMPLFGDVELSDPGTGDRETAAVEAVLELAGDLGSELRYLDVAVVFTGAHVPFGQGMRAWVKRHRKDFDPERTIVIAVAPLGSGGVRYSTREGPRLLSWGTTGDVARLCRDIASDDEDGAAFDAAPVKSRHAGDAVAALSRGLPAIGISTEGREHADPASADRARAFVSELARRIDGELAPRLHEEPIRQE
jgi:hypothetical protein